MTNSELSTLERAVSKTEHDLCTTWRELDTQKAKLDKRYYGRRRFKDYAPTLDPLIDRKDAAIRALDEAKHNLCKHILASGYSKAKIDDLLAEHNCRTMYDDLKYEDVDESVYVSYPVVR